MVIIISLAITDAQISKYYLLNSEMIQHWSIKYVFNKLNHISK